ncbi:MULTISPECIES: anthranilate synthase component II [Halobacterium]|uniref:anthranilate synthase component II n=1 Tax=Halobacterium TaxID=2239 RepID=UPI00073F29D7|nr:MULTISPECIES: anthranilate synthase component II [Halobacterium]MCG1003779.1 aminodeoxychorismate/anthranilate synthase component II [Halobacterium noricense]
MNVLFVDNFDSFTYNLVEYVSEQRVDGERPATTVLKNTASIEEVRDVDPDAIVVSPGPGHPKNERDVGVTAPVLREVSPEAPTLGVCLGMEAAVYEYGGTVDRAPDPMHGKTSPVEHDGRGLFDGIEQEFPAARYHSLACGAIPDCFEVSARTDHDGTELAMAVRHREHPIACVQFHPESVLTAAGHDLVENFLASV